MSHREARFLVHSADAHRVLLVAVIALPQESFAPLASRTIEHLVNCDRATMGAARRISPALLLEELHGGDLVRAVQEKLANDPALGPTVKSIVILWFTGQLQLGQNAAGAATGDDYFQALMWSCIGSHPPALSDGYFGHWRYPPDSGV